MIEVEPKDPRLLRILDENPIVTLPIRGELEHAAPAKFGISATGKVYLDRPDDPSGVLVIGDWVKLHARNEEALERLLPALAEQAEFGTSGVAPWIRDRFAQGWEINWETPCWLWYLEPGELLQPEVLHETRPLRLEHAELVNRHWEHADEDSVQYLRWLIERGPTFAVYEQGEPVSWSLIHWDGAMGPMFTLPEARKRGYAASITWLLAQEILSRGETPFLYTLQSNKPPQRILERFGFRRWGDVRWFGARKRVLLQSQHDAQYGNGG